MKRITLMLGAAGLILILTIVYIKLSLLEFPKEKQYFTPQPETWVEQSPFDSSSYTVNVAKATGADSAYTGYMLDYATDDGDYAFFYSGMYEGNIFSSAYVPQDVLDTMGQAPMTEKGILKKAKMQITSRLDPEDGIIQGFIMARKEGRDFSFYLFVDQDWKNSLDFTNIVYGDDISEGMTERQFEFEEVKPGIYMDKVEDASWYDKSPVVGGLFMGKVTRQDLQSNAPNSTFVVIR